MTSIYFYVPNLIGYLRVLSSAAAFSFAFTDKARFLSFYLASFVCDELDGRLARLLHQTSTFGAVLDMVTDRASTAGLLVVLSHLYKDYFLLFLGLLSLDIVSHWFCMYSSHLEKKSSHKDVSPSSLFILRWYYQSRLFMGFCCVSAEVLYLALFLLHDPGYRLEPKLPLPFLSSVVIVPLIAMASVPGCCIKQFVNVVQLKNAADVCVRYDLERRAEEKKR